MKKELKILPVVVLAGGFGTRLRSEVPNVPKPLAPIGGVPFIFFLLEKWISEGFREFYFSLHFQAQVIVDQINLFVRDRDEELKTYFVVEVEPMGTGGAILEVLSRSGIADEFVVVNADTWLSASLSDLSTLPGDGLGVVKVARNERYGAVDISGDQVVGFREKDNRAGPVYINSGAYKFRRTSFDHIPIHPCSLELDILPTLVAKGLTFVEFEGDFIDIGIPSDYQRFLHLNGGG